MLLVQRITKIDILRATQVRVRVIVRVRIVEQLQTSNFKLHTPHSVGTAHRAHGRRK